MVRIKMLYNKYFIQHFDEYLFVNQENITFLLLNEFLMSFAFE